MRKIKNRITNKKWHIFFVSILAILIITVASLGIQRNSRASVELADINPDDWKLELFFLDENINNGKDPVVDAEWIIDESTHKTTYSHIFTLQVNYKNENITEDYEPGELQIVMPNPFKSSNINPAKLYYSIAVGANDNKISSYSWGYNYNNYANNDFVFSNDKTFEANTSVEGSIQVTFNLSSSNEIPEQFLDECVKSLNQTNLVAKMNDTVESNVASFRFYRKYSHPWVKAKYYINTQTSKITSYDYLGENPDQFTWVKYHFYGKSSSNSSISYATKGYTDSSGQYIGTSSYRVINPFPSDARVLDKNGNPIEIDEYGYFDLASSETNGSTDTCAGSNIKCYDIFVGYPKERYNSELGTAAISNTVEVRGVYSTESDEEVLATSTVNLDLNKFHFEYAGGTASIMKSFNGATVPNTYNTHSFYYQLITSDNGQTGTFTVTASVNYGGEKYTARIGDDMLYYRNPENETYHRLADDEYYFSSVKIPAIRNGNGITIASGKYNYSLFIRHSGQTQFEKYGDYSSFNRTISFEESNIVAWYIDIYDLEESITNAAFVTTLTLKTDSIPRTGTLYNISAVDIIENGVSVNNLTLDNYQPLCAKEEISNYDIETYGHYMQRAMASTNWSYYTVPVITHVDSVSKTIAKAASFDPADDYFSGGFYLTATIADYASGGIDDWDLIAGNIPDADMRTRMHIYDLLPLGMEPDSSEEEILNSFTNCSANVIRLADGTRAFANDAECAEFYKTHTTIKITKNWHNTGRWHIAIESDFSDRPITNYNASHGNTSAYSPISLYRVKINYRISYDAYVERGNTFTNMAYIAPQFPWRNHDLDNDNGKLDPDVVDIDDNGRTDERLWYGSTSIRLLSVTSTVQDLQISVLTDHNGAYDIEDARSGHGEDYTYKLRVRTGANRVTNLVLYDHIEEKYEGNSYWKVSFEGIDTSYAETRLDYYDNPVQIKVYWSDKLDAGSLSEDNSWREYDEETVDKAAVKSLAFEYLDQNGNPAVLTQSSYSYVLVKMKAPENEDISSFAYNNSRSEWNAIDNLTGNIIYNIVGIESNTTRVYLSERFNLKVNKVWQDYDDYYGVRPETLSFTLYYNDEALETKEMNIATGEDYLVFENLDVLEQDNYYVLEQEIEEYVATIEQDPATLSYTFTNTIKREAPAGLEPYDITNPQTSDSGGFLHIICASSAVFILASGIVFHLRRRF